MAIRDVLLHIDSYPEATSDEAIEQAAGFTAAIGGVLSGLAVEVRIRAPNNPLADYLIGLSQLAEEEQERSHAACKAALAEFSRKAEAAGVLGQVFHARADLYLVGEYVAERARTRDLCLVPIADSLDGQRAVAEAVVFGSGRPTVLFRPGVANLPRGGLDTVVLAWDGSRTAARAMSDALPLLAKAREVRVLTVVGEKPGARAGLGEDALRHLNAHGVAAVVDEVDPAGRRVGQVLEDYVEKCGCGLLVMGAYGRSRVREFILGGATEHMLSHLTAPVLLSH